MCIKGVDNPLVQYVVSSFVKQQTNMPVHKRVTHEKMYTQDLTVVFQSPNKANSLAGRQTVISGSFGSCGFVKCGFIQLSCIGYIRERNKLIFIFLGK